jgi:adenine-specific DNA-methyltransferase
VHYIGSKEKLLHFLQTQIEAHVPNLAQASFCDLFAGSGRVSTHFQTLGCHITCNDVEYYSYVLNRAYLTTDTLEEYETQLDTLNALTPIKGFIAEHYAPMGRMKRHYFSNANAMKIDAIRMMIEAWYQQQYINETRYLLLLATLIIAVTYISNTASIYSAYLKSLKKSASQALRLEPLHITPERTRHQVYRDDANHLIHRLKGDILYLDPPYNLRQYGANYHLLNTIAHYKPFVPKGKTGLPEYYSSAYSRQKDAKIALKQLLEHANFKYIFLSYNSDGIINNHDITTILQPLGTYEMLQQEHKRFNSKNATCKSYKTTEYLHILKR